MLKIATVLMVVAAIVCNAAPYSRKWSETERTSVDGQPAQNSMWKETNGARNQEARRQQGQQTGQDNRSRSQSKKQTQEEYTSENRQGNGQNGVLRTNWHYEIAHIQKNREQQMTALQQDARREMGWRLESENGGAQEEEQVEEEDQQEEQNGSEPNQQDEEQASQQEVQEEEQRIDQRGQVVNGSQRRDNEKGSATKYSRRGHNEQQSNGSRQNRPQGGSQEAPQQSSQENEQNNEQEDQIQEEQELNQENRQDDSQENSNANDSPNYEFAYGVFDPETGDHKDQWEKRVGDHLEGGYILDQPDGTKRVVQYKNDGKQGFETNIMQIDRKKGREQSGRWKKEKSVAHSYSNLKQIN